MIKQILASAISFVRNDVKTNDVQLGIVILAGIFCLLPLVFYRNSYLEDSILQQSLVKSEVYRELSSAVIALTIPLSMDTFTDIINKCTTVQQDKLKEAPRGFLLNNIESVVFLCGIIVCPIASLLPSSTFNRVFVFMCCYKCQLVLVGGVVMSTLCRYNKDFWTVRNTYISLLLLAFSACSSASVNNLYQNKPVSQTLSNLYFISWFFSLASAVVFLWGCLWWLAVVIYPHIKNYFSSRTKNTKNYETEQTNVFFPCLFVGISIVALIILIISGAFYTSLDLYDEVALSVSNAVYLLYVLFVSFLSMRMVKFEVVQGLVSLYRIRIRGVKVLYIINQAICFLFNICFLSANYLYIIMPIYNKRYLFYLKLLISKPYINNNPRLRPFH